MSHDDAGMYERAIREGREKELDDQIARCAKENLRMSGCHVPISQCHCKCHVSQTWCCGNCASVDLKDEFVSVHVIHTMRQTIEAWQKGCEVLIVELQSRIKELEEMQKSMISMPNMVWAKYHKTPYKCPVCDGYAGTVLNGVIDEHCHACEGKGILWG
jgi:hypothetical protein